MINFQNWKVNEKGDTPPPSYQTDPVIEIFKPSPSVERGCSSGTAKVDIKNPENRLAWFWRTDPDHSIYSTQWAVQRGEGGGLANTGMLLPQNLF